MRNLQHTATVSRKVKIAGQGQSSEFQVVGTSVRCLVIPVNYRDTLNSNLSVGTDYNVYFESTADIKEGDKIDVSNGATLYINGVAHYDLIGNVSHIEAIATTKK